MSLLIILSGLYYKGSRFVFFMARIFDIRGHAVPNTIIRIASHIAAALMAFRALEAFNASKESQVIAAVDNGNDLVRGLRILTIAVWPLRPSIYTLNATNDLDRCRV